VLFFAAEVQRLADRLYGTALRLTRNREDAEELVALAYLQFFHYSLALEMLSFGLLAAAVFLDFQRRRNARVTETRVQRFRAEA
jgi:hypothetical protein